MSSNAFDLKDFKFTQKSDVVDPGTKIFNDGNVNTFNGDDQIIGDYSVGIDFAASISTWGVSQNAGAAGSAGSVSDVTVFVDGIENKGKIDTKNGGDTIKGTATAIISATAQTASDITAIASTADAAAITASLAAINVNANASGINNSFGTITTKNGSDAIKGDIVGYAQANADASAFVAAIATAPTSEGLTAFASTIAQSFAQATIIARGINNNYGKITTGNGKDVLRSYAQSSSGTDAGAYASVLAAASPENQALAMAIIEATAMAQDVAIGIDNSGGLISTGNGDDTIEAFAEAQNKAIGIFGGNMSIYPKLPSRVKQGCRHYRCGHIQGHIQNVLP